MQKLAASQPADHTIVISISWKNNGNGSLSKTRHPLAEIEVEQNYTASSPSAGLLADHDIFSSTLSSVVQQHVNLAP